MSSTVYIVFNLFYFYSYFGRFSRKNKTEEFTSVLFFHAPKLKRSSRSPSVRNAPMSRWQYIASQTIPPMPSINIISIAGIPTPFSFLLRVFLMFLLKKSPPYIISKMLRLHSRVLRQIPSYRRQERDLFCRRACNFHILSSPLRSPIRRL